MISPNRPCPQRPRTLPVSRQKIPEIRSERIFLRYSVDRRFLLPFPRGINDSTVTQLSRSRNTIFLGSSSRASFDLALRSFFLLSLRRTLFVDNGGGWGTPENEDEEGAKRERRASARVTDTGRQRKHSWNSDTCFLARVPVDLLPSSTP